jgi:Family of unknown function (DUF5687)
MFKKFLYLEWKSFIRSGSFQTNLALKILMIFGVIYFTIVFLVMGIGAFYLIKKIGFEPLATVNKFLIYYVVSDIAMRLFLQKIPVLNIRPLLTLPIKRPTIVAFVLGKTVLSFFNWLHAFFFLPFSIVLLIEGYNPVGVLLWHLGIVAIIYFNNFLNILLSNKDNLFNIFIAILIILAGCQYYKIFDITMYTAGFFAGFYNTTWLFILPVLALITVVILTFNYFVKNAYLDAGLSTKNEIATTENLTWLNQFGTLGTFLKNDIKLIKRNKRSKTTVFMSFLFLFYGLIFFNNPSQPQIMHIFAGIFVSGGFLFTFGQFVPSWDSAYYQLMMTQNIPYISYIKSKWWLIVIATSISTILASFYLFYGWEIYLTIVVGAIYNIGVNSHLVLFAGAYTKTPFDLESSKGAFGDKKAFNIQTMLISLPKLLLPVLLYGMGVFFFTANIGLLLVALAGILGFAFKEKMFNIIVKVYKTEKYKTISAYKQKN